MQRCSQAPQCLGYTFVLPCLRRQRWALRYPLHCSRAGRNHAYVSIKSLAEVNVYGMEQACTLDFMVLLGMVPNTFLEIKNRTLYFPSIFHQSYPAFARKRQTQLTWHITRIVPFKSNNHSLVPFKSVCLRQHDPISPMAKSYKGRLSQSLKQVFLAKR